MPAFHFRQSHVLRLTRRALDIASTDARFNDDFFVEFIFAPITTR
jgi:hypothetical protein